MVVGKVLYIHHFGLLGLGLKSTPQTQIFKRIEEERLSLLATYNTVIVVDWIYVFKWEAMVSDCKTEITLMEKKILYFKGRKREIARRKYLSLLKSCSKECGLEEPIYFDRR